MSKHDYVFSTTFSRMDNAKIKFIHSLFIKQFDNGHNSKKINCLWELLFFPDVTVKIFDFSVYETCQDKKTYIVSIETDAAFQQILIHKDELDFILSKQKKSKLIIED